ncbi:hypothetical protein Ddc_05902 [Ditylenchus destructor]|nr:hypothetical protein Ddc_05902 [Ditylenchus destructor]
MGDTRLLLLAAMVLRGAAQRRAGTKGGRRASTDQHDCLFHSSQPATRRGAPSKQPDTTCHTRTKLFPGYLGGDAPLFW